jgi:hypothetical protein
MGNRLFRRLLKTEAEKSVRRLEHRLDDLYTMGREGRLRVPLEKPIFWGYRREFVLREDIARRQDAERLLVLLSKIQKVEDSKRKDFKVWDRPTKRWRDWHHKPRKLSPREFQSLPPDLKCHFNSTWSYWKGLRYEITHTWMFVTRRSKLYLTHRFIPNVEVEQEISYLSERYDQGRLWQTYSRVKSRKTSRRWSLNAKRYLLRDRQAWLERDEALEIHAGGRMDLERGKEVMTDAKA